jgi:hypothetical protein
MQQIVIKTIYKQMQIIMWGYCLIRWAFFGFGFARTFED